jgi:hypothetical protein
LIATIVGAVTSVSEQRYKRGEAHRVVADAPLGDQRSSTLTTATS